MTLIASADRIYLLRHAEAAPAKPGQRDFDRALTDKGYADAELIGEHAADKGYRPDLVISSTANRCRQTAQALRHAVGPDLDIRYLDTLYEAAPEVYLTLIDADEGVSALMIVGHNPTIEQTLERLIGRDALQLTLPNGFPPAGLAALQRQSRDGHWRLFDFLKP